MSKFKTAGGRLTAYALACGYVEKRAKASIEVTLWHEHGTYHVRAHNFAEHGRLWWESFRSLAEARKCFDSKPLEKVSQ